jgi:hypothetical protein
MITGAPPGIPRSDEACKSICVGPSEIRSSSAVCEAFCSGAEQIATDGPARQIA